MLKRAECGALLCVCSVAVPFQHTAAANNVPSPVDTTIGIHDDTGAVQTGKLPRSLQQPQQHLEETTDPNLMQAAHPLEQQQRATKMKPRGSRAGRLVRDRQVRCVPITLCWMHQCLVSAQLWNHDAV